MILFPYGCFVRYGKSERWIVRETASDDKHSGPDEACPKLDKECPKLDKECPKLDEECPKLDKRCPDLGEGCPAPDAEYSLSKREECIAGLKPPA